MTDMPEEIFIGKIQGEWPLHAWEAEAHATVWLSESSPQTGRQRRLWKATVTYDAELDLVKPVPARLKVKESR
jgi:hypothetical protein